MAKRFRDNANKINQNTIQIICKDYSYKKLVTKVDTLV